MTAKKVLIGVSLALILAATCALMTSCGMITSTITKNGAYDTRGVDYVFVEVPQSYGTGETLSVTENGAYDTFGYDSISVNVPQNVEIASNYNVTINTVTPTETNRDRIEVIEELRPTVVDVYGSANSGNTSAGSGVIIGKLDGKNGGKDNYFIVTNHHVIEGCTAFEVNLLFIGSDGAETYDTYEADLIGGSPSRDIAVLRIEKKADESISTAPVVSDSRLVKVGTDVIAIGNPLGVLGGTVTMGIISATARDVTVENVGTMTLMQTDAAINSGNSGGGLFDLNGNLVGVVNSGYSSYEGLNFAIPANDALYAANSIIKTYDAGRDEPYGYVIGDTEMGFSCTMMSTDSNTYVVARVYSTSPLYGAWGKVYGAAVLSVTVDYADEDLTDRTKTIASISDMTEIIKTVSAGDEVTFRYREVVQKTTFPPSYNINYEEKTVTVTAEQYVYIP